MATDTQNYCDLCDACNQTKPALTQLVPLVNMPIGIPWEMLGVDILNVPMLCQVNSYIIVIAESTVKVLVETLSIYDIPTYIHSD